MTPTARMRYLRTHLFYRRRRFSQCAIRVERLMQFNNRAKSTRLAVALTVQYSIYRRLRNAQLRSNSRLAPVGRIFNFT